MGDSEFQEEARNIDPTIPSASDVPSIPTDVRSGAAWDSSAQDMLNLKVELDETAPTQEPSNPDNLDSSFQTLKQRAQAYKADDPQ